MENLTNAEITFNELIRMYESASDLGVANGIANVIVLLLNGNDLPYRCCAKYSEVVVRKNNV